MRGKGFSRNRLALLALASSLFWMTSLSACVARSAEEREIRRVYGKAGADLNATFESQTGEKSPRWEWILLPVEDYLKR